MSITYNGYTFELLEGTSGNDRLSGGSTADWISGFEGDDVLVGNNGSDELDGGTGADTMVGGLGNDEYTVDDINDVVVENAGAGWDTIFTDLSSYSIASLVSVEGLTGMNGDQQLTGNAGWNVIDGGAGADLMTGGAGADVYFVDNVGDSVVEIADQGTDEIYTGLATYSLETLQNVENLTGQADDQQLTGNAANNVIYGGGGADSMRGVGGDDSYDVDNAGDRVLEGAGAGTDTVTSSVSFVLGPNVENLFLSGSAAINGNGNALANGITGNSAANILNGLGGADTMAGGGGDDIYFVDNTGDSAAEGGGGGVDLVKSSVSFTLGDNVEKLLLFGLAAIDATGNSVANTLTGNGAANSLAGLGGSDYLAAGAGTDRLDGGGGNDQMIGGAGGDQFVFASALNAATNVDWIRDFSVADDTIVLDGAFFAAMSANGPLSDAEFHTGSAAADADDRIIYNSATGNIYYDADGSGAGAQILFARVAIGLGMSAADFTVEGGLFGG